MHTKQYIWWSGLPEQGIHHALDYGQSLWFTIPDQLRNRIWVADLSTKVVNTVHELLAEAMGCIWFQWHDIQRELYYIETALLSYTPGSIYGLLSKGEDVAVSYWGNFHPYFRCLPAVATDCFQCFVRCYGCTCNIRTPCTTGRVIWYHQIQFRLKSIQVI